MGWREWALRAYRAVGIPALVGLERLQTGAVFFPAGRRFYEDPYPMYRRLRERDPFHRSRLVGWVATRYEDVVEILRDSRFSADDRKRPDYERNRARLVRAGIVDADDVQEPSMLRSDAPDHTRLRGLVSRAFTPRAVERWRKRIEGTTEELLDRLPRGGRVDVMSALAGPLPVIVIAEMLGVPREDQARFKHWSDEVVRSMGMSSFDDLRRSRAAWRELRGYLEGIAAERRREPRDDLLSALLSAEEQGDRLSLDEVFSTCNLLLVAGNETTTNLIGNATLALLRHPDQLERLRGDAALTPHAVEELLRWDSPVQYTSRIALEPVEIAGERVEAGQEVILVLGAANRDPEHFPAPDVLDLGRQDIRHLSFGHGVHFCLGAQLARLEGEVAIGALVRRFPDLCLDDSAPRWRANPILRGLERLPVRV